MLSERLKIETHKSHIDVEKLIIPRIKKLDAKRSYTSLLKIFYGYFKPIEDKLDAIVDNELLPDYAERRKASAILEDIEFVNRETCETVWKDLPEIETSEQALGALYVMEGSTLGGTILTKLVTEKM